MVSGDRWSFTSIRAGFDFKKGRKVFVQVGDGKLIPVYLHDIAVQIGATQFVAPIGFSAGLGVPFNLLGRSGTFEHFRICFHEKKKSRFVPGSGMRPGSRRQAGMSRIAISWLLGTSLFPCLAHPFLLY